MRRLLGYFLICLAICLMPASTAHGFQPPFAAIRGPVVGVGPGLSALTAVTTGGQTLLTFDRTGIEFEYDWSTYVNPGNGQIASCNDSSGNNRTATMSLETGKPVLVGQHIETTAAKGLIADTNPMQSSFSTWAVYAFCDPDNQPTETEYVYFSKRPFSAPLWVLELDAGTLTYGSGWTSAADFGRWNIAGTNLPKAVYAWTHDGSKVYKYVDGVLDGQTNISAAMPAGAKAILCARAEPTPYVGIPGKHWYFAVFSGYHDSARVLSTSNAIWSIYGGRL